MRNPFERQGGSTGGGFLPEDYVNRKAEARANFLSLGLFGVVMFGVVGAFFVTNRQWLQVRREQEKINTQYAAEAAKIEQLKRLEEQKAQMMSKAGVTTALIEKVPRSVLMAELVTRMPKEITLLEMELKGTRQKDPATGASDGKKAGGAGVKNLSGGSGPGAGSKGKGTGSSPAASYAKAKAAKAAAGEGSKEKDTKKEDPAAPPKIDFTLRMVGVAPENGQIADYISALRACTLLDKVELKYIKETEVDKTTYRKFEIEAAIKTDADARGIEPVAKLQQGSAAAAPASAAAPAKAVPRAAEPRPAPMADHPGDKE